MLNWQKYLKVLGQVQSTLPSSTSKYQVLLNFKVSSTSKYQVLEILHQVPSTSTLLDPNPSVNTELVENRLFLLKYIDGEKFYRQTVMRPPWDNEWKGDTCSRHRCMDCMTLGLDYNWPKLKQSHSPIGIRSLRKYQHWHGGIWNRRKKQIIYEINKLYMKIRKLKLTTHYTASMQKSSKPCIHKIRNANEKFLPRLSRIPSNAILAATTILPRKDAVTPLI